MRSRHEVGATLPWRMVAAMVAAAFVIVVLRSVEVSITHDEALTIVGPVHATDEALYAFAAPGAPDNNHLLLSLLAKASARRFGEHDWAFRLPSVIAFVAYALAICAILRRLVAGAPWVLLAALALFNPALLEAFSLARGYGLGIALSCCGLWWLLRSFDADARAWFPTLSVWSLALATLAHLVFLLHFVVGTALVATAFIDAGRRRARTRLQLGFMAIGPLSAVVVVTPILHHQIAILRHQGLLATEGKTSFFVDTAMGAMEASIGPLGKPWLAIGTGVALCTVACAVAAVIVRWLRAQAGEREPASTRDAAIMLAALLGVAGLSVVQHYVAGVAYLAGRRAVPLIPLFVSALAAVLAMLPASVPGRRATTVVAGACAVLLGLQLRGVNLDTTRTWWFDADTREMMTQLDCLVSRRWPGPEFRIGMPWELQPGIDYYRMHLPMTRLREPDRHGMRPGFDAYYFIPDASNRQPEMQLAGGLAELGPLVVVATYPRTHAVLAVPEGSPLVDPAPGAARACAERQR
ncbi:MAG: hypothetical protein JSR18_15310 [Proteobacteria bacterium]|nr:hypothetical protein [Pseudomonadota bacterium]